MVEYKVDLDDVELTLFELLDLGELAATPFLRALGEILVAEVLVRRAALAGRLLRTGDGRARFLQGKIEVARFHVTQLLPGADADIGRVASEDRSALADVL